MTIMKLRKSDDILIDSVEPAFSLGSRMRGLLGRKGIPNGHALYIKPCSSIHTVCMRFKLDLIFLDRSFNVIKIVRNVSPSRMVLGGKGAASVIELESGWFDFSALCVGDKVDICAC